MRGSRVAFSFRPSFTLDVDASSTDTIERLAAGLTATKFVLRRTRPPGGGMDASRRDTDQLVLTVPANARHFWSPWLTIEVEPRAPTSARVSAMFSPHPSVWTGYLFGYLALAVVLLFSLIYAAAIAMSGDGGAPWSLWIGGGAIVAMLGMWYASVVGQRLARAQMDALQGALAEVLAHAPASADRSKRA
jgi:hypothetical protein